MTPKELAPFIEHTLLKAEATSGDIERLCAEAVSAGFKGVCVNSRFIAEAVSRVRGSRTLSVCVVGFPLGACLSSVKACETELAVRAGADEIDMVIALGPAKHGDWAEVAADVAAVVGAAAGKPVKAILETGLLKPDEIAKACVACEEAGASFVKTATGFLGRGASVEDVVLMRKSVSRSVGIKASGGIKTFADASALIAAGASRLGTSSGLALVGVSASGKPDAGAY